MEGHLMATNFEKLRAKLEEMFMLDRADLDFGIYRIMNSKRDEILRFLDNDLLPQVRQVLQAAQGEIGAAGADELKQAEEQVRSLGMNPDDSPKVKELRSKYSANGDLKALEQEVFNHLYSFFRRYYDEGDFLSLRRYKEGVYAIPYEGEEVKLHWANADQYYIKTAEHFRNYTFKVGPEDAARRVHFKLVDAETEKDNNRASEKRVFILTGVHAIAEENGELLIRFEYRAAPDKRKQKEHIEEAVARILAEANGDWKGLLHAKAPTDKSPNRTVLEKHLTDYTARNTFDYFIHKDLGGFLRRELDFYIKNEVMHLDDIEHETAPKVEQYLAKIRAIRRVAGKLIDFLAQLEEFQKALWLKKKFVVDTQYLVTLDRVPESLYAEIAANEAQRLEWVSLFSIDEIGGELGRAAYSEPLSVEFLRENSFLTLNTKLFSAGFKSKLLASMVGTENSQVDTAQSGLLVRGDNFHALNLLQRRFREKVKTVYGDPPYNAKSSEILYKNTYKHASWLSLMDSRIGLAKRLLTSDGVFIIAIDENEQHRLSSLLESHFSDWTQTVVTVVHNPGGIQGRNFSYTHEFAIFLHPSVGKYIGTTQREQADVVPLRDWGGEESKRGTAANCFYPIYVRDGVITGFGDVCDDGFHPEASNLVQTDGSISVYPIDQHGIERKWRHARQSVEGIEEELEAVLVDDEWVIRRNKSRYRYKTVWSDSKYNANTFGSKLLGDILGRKAFSFPKSVYNAQDCVLATTQWDKHSWIADFFAGSGTTVHGIFCANKFDGGTRKFIAIEMGAYFDSVLVERVRRCAYSESWTEGKPDSRSCGTSQLVKILELETYEDALANLMIRTLNVEQAQLMEASSSMYEDYLLRYMLNAESSNNPSTLNIQSFDHPFEYKLKVAADTVGETKEVNVDLVETFNWLLGLRVHTMDVIRGFHVVTGRLPGQGNSENGEKALIIWRDTTENPNAKLDEFFGKQAYNTQDQEFDVIYVNGDNNLQNLRKDDQTWKVRLIEEEFHRLMWDVEDV